MMWQKYLLGLLQKNLVLVLFFSVITTAYANGQNTDIGNAYSQSGTTVTQHQNTNPDQTQSMQELAQFLAQNPGVAQQVSGILNGQSTTTTNSGSPPPHSASQASTAQTSDTSSDASESSGASSPEGSSSANNAMQNIKNNAFDSVANQAFPLSPDQIKALNNMLDETQRAQAAAPHDSPPQPTSSSIMVNLSPGSTPPVIRLTHGFVSSLVFVDSTGAEWPIESYDIGNPNAFNISWDKKSNTLMIQARSSYTYGNLAIKLKELNTPVMLTLVPGQKVVDYRVDLRIEGLGPNAKPGMQSSGLPSQADPVLLNVLDGAPPEGAKRLSVSSNVVQVWVVNDKVMYVRTAFTLISPAWLSKMSSADGMNAYQLQVTPMLLLSRYGKVLQIKVEGL